MTMRVQSLEKNAQEQQAVAERLSAQLEAAFGDSAADGAEPALPTPRPDGVLASLGRS